MKIEYLTEMPELKKTRIQWYPVLTEFQKSNAPVMKLTGAEVEQYVRGTQSCATAIKQASKRYGIRVKVTYDENAVYIQKMV